MTNSGSCAAAPRICICDSEVSYGEHLVEYLRQEGRLARDIYLYTSREMFLEKETPLTTRLLVIAQSQYSEEIVKAGSGSCARRRRRRSPAESGTESP